MLKFVFTFKGGGEAVAAYENFQGGNFCELRAKHFESPLKKNPPPLDFYLNSGHLWVERKNKTDLVIFPLGKYRNTFLENYFKLLRSFFNI